MSAATRDHRGIVLAALEAGNFGSAIDADLAAAIRDGRGDVELAAFDFDSLGVMEFCISVELQTGLELTPTLVAEMKYVAEVEAWLRERL